MRHSASLDTRICHMTARRSVGRLAAPPDVGVSCWRLTMDRYTNELALAGCLGTVWRSFGTNRGGPCGRHRPADQCGTRHRSPAPMRHSASTGRTDGHAAFDRPERWALGIDRPGRNWHRQYPRRVLTRGLSNRPRSSRIHASLACQDLTRRYVCPAPGGSGCTPGPPRRMRGPVAIQHPARVLRRDSPRASTSSWSDLDDLPRPDPRHRSRGPSRHGACS